MSLESAASAVALGMLALLLGAPAGLAQEPASTRLTSWRVRDNIYMIVGAGGNTTLHAGADGVLVVDTKLPSAAGVLLDAIRQISSRPIRYVINTHWHADHVGGNQLLASSGSIIAGNRQQALLFNGEAIEILPSAHIHSDNIVFFRTSGVISTGDLFTTSGYPAIRRDDGGSIDGVIAALNRIVDITTSGNKPEGGTLVIPGHGRVSEANDVVGYRDMVTTIRDRIDTMVQMGMTLEQVQAAKPTADYDGRYGDTTGIWTTEQFIAATYDSLQNQ
jgi:glyoxylase-like metal-dependent hydrolase (beta-lactamase superfamily II)